MTRVERERRSHGRDLVIGVAIILIAAPAAWWATGYFISQLGIFGRAFGWAP